MKGGNFGSVLGSGSLRTRDVEGEANNVLASLGGLLTIHIIERWRFWRKRVGIPRRETLGFLEVLPLVPGIR